jgi:hypothetical protein
MNRMKGTTMNHTGCIINKFGENFLERFPKMHLKNQLAMNDIDDFMRVKSSYKCPFTKLKNAI